MIMGNYIEQINSLEDIFKRCDFQYGLKCCLEQRKDEVLNIGIIGINVIDHLELINKLCLEGTNTKLVNLNLQNEGDPSINTSCDMVIQVIDAVQPVTKGDFNLYTNLSKYYNNIIFVLSRLRYIDEEEVDDLKNYIDEKLNIFNENKKVFYLDEDISFGKLVQYLKESSNNDLMKNSVHRFKLNAFNRDAFEFFKENINLLDNWEVEKNKEIDVMNNRINKLYFYGEGFALYFHRYIERVEKYIISSGKDDTKYIQRCFNDFISCVEVNHRKYLGLDGVKTNVLNLFDDKYSSTPCLFIEDTKILTNKNINHLISKINKNIVELKNKSKDTEHLNTLKECYKELIDLGEGLYDE